MKASAPQRLLQSQAHHLQHPIAEPVAQRIVDGFEVIQIHEQQRDARPACAAAVSAADNRAARCRRLGSSVSGS